MKKLLSVALAATVALTTVNIQAGDKTKKVWAYTKIAYGASNLMLFSVIVPTFGIHFRYCSPKLKDFLKALKLYKTNQTTDFLIEAKKSYWLGFNHATSYNDIISPLWSIPLGILAIQSGIHDLKKLKKKETKQKTHENNSVEAG